MLRRRNQVGKNIVACFVVCALLFLCSNSAHGQVFFQDKYGKMRHPEMMTMFRKSLVLMDTLECRRKDFYKMYIMYCGDDVVLFSDGYFDVFLWKDARWNRVSRVRRGGYNFNGKKFIWRDRIFSFGGYGYWRHHGDVIEFDRKSGNWVKLELSETLPFAPAMVTDTGLRVISDTIYDVNFTTLAVEKHPSGVPFKLDNNSVARGLKLESTSWAFLLLGKENYLLDKKNQQLYYSDLNTTELIDKTFFYKYSLIQFKGDSLLKWSLDGQLIQAIDIRNLLQFYKSVDLQVKNTWAGSVLGYISVVVLLGGGSAYWFTRRRKRKSQSTMWQNPIIQLLLSAAGPPLSMEQLDILLALESIQSMEYRKYKRAQILSEVNEEYKHKLGRELVVRLKDPEDGRRFVYEVRV